MNATGENLLRELAPQVLGAVIRRFRDFSAAEDAVQEALLAAALQWPEEGVPDNPRGWLIQVAARRMTDHVRAELARRRRETVVVMQAPTAAAARLRSRISGELRRGRRGGSGRHADPAVHVLSPGAHASIGDRAHAAGRRRPHDGRDRERVSGARGDDGAAHQPGQAEHQGVRRAVPACRPRRSARERLSAVLHVLYLIFNEGYASSIGPAPAAPRSVERGDSAHAGRSPPAAATTARSRDCWR